MSRRLFKSRIAEDFELPPLDSEAGQQFLDQVIEAVGGINMLHLDNIQALTEGDLREPESWRKVLPWMRSSTARQIGQAWVHHTGHDESHGYGDKSREWQLDTVCMMETVEDRADTDLAFNIKFLKARERSPDNRSDFEPAMITLTDNRWASDRGGVVSGRKGKGTARDFALALLFDVLARHGTVPAANSHIPFDTPCVDFKMWQATCRMAGVSASADPESADRTFRRAARELVNRGLVGKWGELVWAIARWPVAAGG